MRSNSSCVIRCTLDNMFRNSKQFSGSPPPAFSLEGAASSLAASNDHECGMPICRQFMDIDVHSRYTLDPAQVPSHITGRSSRSFDGQCPNMSMHTQCTLLGHTHLEMCTHAPLKEIREYDFLRRMEEGPRPVLAHEDVDCTLHLATVPSETDCSVVPTKRLSTISMLDMREPSEHFVRESMSVPSFGRATHSVQAIPESDLAHSNCAPKKEYNVGSLPWDSSASSIMWRTSEAGACMSTLLRENTHDIEECASSSRTSSNSSGNTLKASAALSESSIMHNYSRPRERENFLATAPSAASFGPKQWFQCSDHSSFAGALANTKAGSLRGNDPYRNLAASNLSAQGGNLTPHVFPGIKSSNSKEASNYVIRICAQCKTMRTPLWRNGPQGPKSLCNACGIRYKKEERRSVAVEDSKLHQQDPDQRPRSSSMDAGDQRPVHVGHQRSGFIHDNRRPGYVANTLEDKMRNKEQSEDQRSKIVDIADEASRFLAAREKRPKLVNGSANIRFD